MKVTWSACGRRTAADAGDYIARDRPETAAEWVEKLVARVDLLGRFPQSGRIVPELGKPDLREVVVPPFRIIYRIEPKRVYVLAIWHGRQVLTASALADESQ